jgi:hypothetical protein
MISLKVKAFSFDREERFFASVGSSSLSFGRVVARLSRFFLSVCLSVFSTLTDR